jgi:hypothetical protein
MNNSLSNTAIGINLGSPNGIPTKPVNAIEIITLKTNDRGFINDDDAIMVFSLIYSQLSKRTIQLMCKNNRFIVEG